MISRSVFGMPGGVGVHLFSWGPGDNLVLAHSSKLGRESALISDPAFLEIRLRSPWEQWRTKKIQSAYQVFYEEGQNVWSRACAAVDGRNSNLEERRRQLAFEAVEYKRIHFTLMQRVGDLSDVSTEDRREFSQDITSHLRRLYRGHQAWHLVGIVLAHLARPVDLERVSDLALDLAHWKQEHQPLDDYEVLRARIPIWEGGGGGVSNEWLTALMRYLLDFRIDQAELMVHDALSGGPALGDTGAGLLQAVQGLLGGLLSIEDAAEAGEPVDGAWRQWRQRSEWRTAEALAGGAGRLGEQMAAVLGVLKGDVDQIGAYSDSWLQTVIAHMLLRRDDRRLGVADLASLAEDVLAGDERGRDPHGLDGVITALVRLDMQGAVQAFADSLLDWWSAAHLADICYRGSYIPFSTHFAADLRLFGWRELVALLTASNRLWQVAAAYVTGALDYDSTAQAGTSSAASAQRRDALLALLADLVCRQRADSDRACRRLLLAGPAGPDGAGAETAEGMEGIDALEGPAPATEWAAAAGAVQRAWGMRLQAQGRHWAGLVWLSRGGAGRTVADLAMRVLERVVVAADGGPEPVSLEELEPLLGFLESPHAAADPRAAALIQVVREFGQVRQILLRVGHLAARGTARTQEEHEDLEAKSREAAGRVLGLLQEGSPRRAPPRFWPELLAYTVPLLEAPPPPGPGPAPPPVLSSQQVYACMAALEDVTGSWRAASYGLKHPSAVLRVQATRLALTRGLAVALQYEAARPAPSS